MSRKSSTAIPRPGEGKRGPEGHLGYLLRQASASFRGATDRALADLGVTSPQFGVLTMISAYPGASGADLARLTFLTPQTINVIVRNLEKGGAIAKTAHAEHGRILQLGLTPKGRDLLRRCRARVMQIEARIDSLADGEEAKAVRLWLSAVAEKLTEGR